MYFQISGAGLGEFKAPLTTIAENWEFSVSERNQKQEQVEDESTSGSETEGSESDSGSNEESSSSSCSSIESDSSSDNNDDLKKVCPLTISLYEKVFPLEIINIY